MVYISGQISETDDYMERFEEAEKELKSRGFSVINPAKVNSMMPKETTYDQYMQLSFAMLDCADRIYMMDGWEKSRGARMEHDRAKEKGMEIRYLKDYRG